MKRRLFEFLALLALGGAAQAAPVTVSGGWFRALPAGLPAGGYFTARNGGTHDLAITGARSAACGTLMLHRSSDTGGMSGMAMVAKVDLPAGATIRFAPGGYHLMCTRPTPLLRQHAMVPVVLNLSDGTSVTTPFAVRDARGK